MDKKGMNYQLSFEETVSERLFAPLLGVIIPKPFLKLLTNIYFVTALK